MDDISKLSALVNRWRSEAKACVIDAGGLTDPETVGKQVTRRTTLIECSNGLEDIISTLSMAQYLHIKDVKVLIEDMAARTQRACGKAVLQADKSGSPEEIIKKAYAACIAAKANGPYLPGLESHSNITDFWNKVF